LNELIDANVVLLRVSGDESEVDLGTEVRPNDAALKQLQLTVREYFPAASIEIEIRPTVLSRPKSAGHSKK
jgi:hypothetical protein